MSIIIETLYIVGKMHNDEEWNLAYASKYKIVLGISSTLFLLLCTILCITICKGARNLKKLKENPERSSVIASGLKQTRPCFMFMYYFHYFFIRSIITFMVLLTPFSRSSVLWLVMLFVQTLILVYHFIKFYDSWSLYLQGIVREIYIMGVVIIMVINQYADQSTEELKMKAFKNLVKFSTAMTITFSVISLSVLGL